MESKPASNHCSSLNSVYTDTVVTQEYTEIFQAAHQRDLRGLRADIARIERFKDTNRDWVFKYYGNDYAYWIDDLCISLQLSTSSLSEI